MYIVPWVKKFKKGVVRMELHQVSFTSNRLINGLFEVSAKPPSGRGFAQNGLDYLIKDYQTAEIEAIEIMAKSKNYNINFFSPLAGFSKHLVLAHVIDAQQWLSKLQNTLELN